MSESNLESDSISSGFKKEKEKEMELENDSVNNVNSKLYPDISTTSSSSSYAFSSNELKHRKTAMKEKLSSDYFSSSSSSSPTDDGTEQEGKKKETKDLESPFECNICLDEASNPVVSLCGHLYCWPCIHQWISSQAVPLCPVCKAGIGPDKVIPIYAKGATVDPRKSTPTSSTDNSTPNRPRGQRPTPQYNQNFSNFDSFFPQNFHGTQFHFSPGFGLFPSMFGVNFFVNFHSDGIRHPQTPEEAHQAALSRFFVVFGILFLVFLLFP